MLESKHENVSCVRLDDLPAVTPKTRVFWDVRHDDFTAITPKTRAFWDETWWSHSGKSKDSSLLRCEAWWSHSGNHKDSSLLGCETWWSQSGNSKDSSVLGWECNALSLGKQFQTYVRIAMPSKCWELFTQWHRVTFQKTPNLASGMLRGTVGRDKIVT